MRRIIDSPNTKPNPKNQNLHYFYLSSNALIDSCPLPKSHIHKKTQSSHVLIVDATSAMKLSEYLKKSKIHMEYYHAEKMIDCIGKQLQILENQDLGIPLFNLDDITVFFIRRSKDRSTTVTSDEDTDEDTDTDTDTDDDTDDHTKGNILYDERYDIYFAITNDEKIQPFSESLDSSASASASATASASASASPATENKLKFQQLVIQTPMHIETSTYKKNKAFISPEIDAFMKTKKIPYNIHFKSGYYSFGLLCIYCLLTTKQVPTQHTTDPLHIQNEIVTVLQTIINTKIYWFLTRVLTLNPSERRYICV